MKEVIVRDVPDYHYEHIIETTKEVIDILGGISSFVKRGQKVLIKPNLLAGFPPERAIVTHPLIIRAVSELVIDAGVRPVIGESPAVGSFKKVIKSTGLIEALKGLDVTFKEFTHSTTVEAQNPFKRLELADDVLEADVIINLPKLKTHGQMLLTLGIKNLFGCVVGMKKPQWHYRAGVNEEYFAQLLVTICQILKPSLTILDGILSLEGDGPGTGGSPRYLGVIMASTDPLALDITVSTMLNLKPEAVPTNKAALKMLGSSESYKNELVVNGELPDIRDFKFPDRGHLIFGPLFTHKFMRSHFVTRPSTDKELCKLCGECWKYCPAQVIQLQNKELKIDYEKCIRCFCCVEVCPHGAMKTKTPPAGQTFNILNNMLAKFFV
jgi:uncharacterized protein (DUF362 family)/Pyruvate/2-oxoacid:ferredoxin oxidoreductase delta subunit